MIRRTNVVCLLALALLLPVAARAEHTRYWRQTDFAEFQKGTPKGVAVRSDGKLRPAPKFDSFADPNLAYVWALRMNSKGQLYAAGGSDAKVMRFDDAGKPATVFESSELAAQAIAFDSADNLYVGTSPDGKVYQVTPDGKKSVFFEPKTKYIWALAVDSQGTLFVATGDAGQVFAVTPDGKGKVFYQSRERHARSLAFDSKGNLLIGTEPDGLVVRVEVTRKAPKAAPEAGASFVVYETSKAEVTSLLADSDGNIYAASIGDKSRLPLLPRVPPAAVAPVPAAVTGVTAGGGVTAQTQGPAQPPIVFQFPSISTAGGAEVVRIAPDGSPQTLWTSRDDLVLSIGLSPAGRLLLGTGNSGSLIELEDNNVYSSVATTAAGQVTSLIAGPAGKVFVATANPGKIFTLGPGSEPNGSFESEAFDAKIFSRWGRLTWWGDNGATAGKVEFYVRSGNTSTPEDNWSPWSGPYKDASGGAVTCPSARFVQWKVVFVENDQGLAPGISWVSLAYQPKNVAPVVDDIVVEDPNIRAIGFPMPSAAGNAVPVQLRYARNPGSSAASMTVSGGDSSSSSRNEPPPQGFQQKGYQSVLWSAHDDNDDDLTFTIYFRGESEKDWRILKDKVTQRYYSWDTVSMPDGAYYLKIVAADSPSNPADQALWGARESDRWIVANTPPRIENLRAGAGLLNTKASFDAIASSGAVARAEYSIDAGEWQIVFPVDSLSDAPKESYFMQLPGLSLGEHTLAVQVTDDFNNTATAKTTFTVYPRSTSK